MAPRGNAIRSPLGVKQKTLILEQLELGMFEEFLGLLRLVDDFKQFAQPAILLTIGPGVGFIGPVRRDAQFGFLMHFAGADLDFDAVPLRPRSPPYAGCDSRWVWGSRYSP